MATADETAVLAVHAQWLAAFQSVDPVRMKALFDQDYAGIVYQAEESPEPMVTWAAIDAYWSAAPAIVAAIPEWRELTRKVALDGDTAFVYTKLQTRIDVKGAKRPLIGELRASIGMHRTGQGWKIIHYHESRLVELAFLFAD